MNFKPLVVPSCFTGAAVDEGASDGAAEESAADSAGVAAVEEAIGVRRLPWLKIPGFLLKAGEEAEGADGAVISFVEVSTFSTGASVFV